MNCNQFRSQLPDLNQDVSQPCLEHLESCNSCNQWLGEQVKTAPDGLGQPYLEQPPIRIAEQVLPHGPSWIEQFIRMILAGLAVGATAYIWLWMPDPGTSPGSFKTMEKAMPAQHPEHEGFSFLSEEVRFTDIHFVEPLAQAPSEEKAVVAQTWSFLDSENPLNFIDENQEEDS